MNTEINQLHRQLSHHPLYEKLNSLDNIKIFMQYHVFAVWDFMTLLKSIQRSITCVSIPWRESLYDPQFVRLINEIVLGEESDTDQNGNASSHFSLYLRAMEEIGADTQPIINFLENLDFEKLPAKLSEIIAFHLNLAREGEVHEVASSFFYGREKLIPDMFTSILKIVEEEELNCPTLIYYFKRHIELDSENHGPAAQICLEGLTVSRDQREQAAMIAKKSLIKRCELWDFIEKKLA